MGNSRGLERAAVARSEADMPVRAWGAEVVGQDQVRFRVWAPGHEQVRVRFEGRGGELPMNRDGDWHELVTSNAAPGSRYRYVLPDGNAVADPASCCQPDGVTGPSEVVDLTGYDWQHEDWRGRPWAEAVVYELHVGTFTPEGTFRAAITRLPHLATLGVTAIELMPVAAFAGSRNWGYDGVFTYAPAAAYGRPEDLQALIDAAHGAGLMVILDVVYNHFGPEGNVMHAVAPEFFTERHETPWGAGFAFDQADAVREFFIDNALHWIGNYRVDGLRLDAVHAIEDDSDVHIIDAIAQAVAARHAGRHVHLILENEDNEAHRLERAGGRPKLFTAQWNDDVHHGLHVAATGEKTGYYADYLGDTQKLARALAEGFAYQGETMGYSGKPRGEPSSHLPPPAFVTFLQNHDQVGNRAFGDRLTTLAGPEVVRALAAVQLLLPQVPMLFMGEEWSATQPFPFFCDFTGELKQKVVEGRRSEFAKFPEFSDPEQRARIPDPCSAKTFASAKLRWEDATSSPGREALGWYRRVLEVRQREIVPRLARITRGGVYSDHGNGAIEVRWSMADGGWLRLVANLAGTAADTLAPLPGRVIWREGHAANGHLPPWSVEWSVGVGGDGG